MKNNTIDAKLLNAQVAIDNAMDSAVISTALAPFSYDKKKLQAGKTLYEKAQALHTRQKKEYGEQYAATDGLEAARSRADKIYMRHLKLARIALETNGKAMEALQLNGRRKKTYSGWIQQTKQFYDNALASAEISTTLATLGIKKTVLTAGQAAVREVQTLLKAQLKEKSEAQTATEERDKALEALMDWMSDFTTIARIAFKDDPQQLEMLGIVVAS